MNFIEYNKPNVIEEKQKQNIYQELLVPENPRWRYLSTNNQGSFGRVKLVKSKDDGKFYCAKIMKKIELIKAQQVDHISNEYQILKSITHPFIVRLFLFRSIFKEWTKIVNTSTFSWSILLVVNSSLTFVKKVCSNLIKLRK